MLNTIRNNIIPALNTFCNVPIIESDQEGDKPTGAHVTFKFTSVRIKDVGQAEEKPIQTDTTYEIQKTETYKVVISFTAIDNEFNGSEDLANKLYDWFDFYGADILTSNNIVVTQKTNIQNRDIFIADYYERRNGFDVTIRGTSVIKRSADYIEKAIVEKVN